MILRTREELAFLFGDECRKVFMRHLNASGVAISSRRRLTQAEQLRIFAHLGLPLLMDAEERALWAPELEAYRALYHITPPLNSV